MLYCMDYLQGDPGDRILCLGCSMVQEAAGELPPAAAAFAAFLLRSSLLVSIKQAGAEKQSPSAFQQEAATPCWRLTDGQHLRVDLFHVTGVLSRKGQLKRTVEKDKA